MENFINILSRLKQDKHYSEKKNYNKLYLLNVEFLKLFIYPVSNLTAKSMKKFSISLEII